MLAYPSRYTHRVAISNSRLIAFDEDGVTFHYKDYRRGGADRQQVMTLTADEFIRRFLLHTLPRGFHRIRHYGLLAKGPRTPDLRRLRTLIAAQTGEPAPPSDPEPAAPEPQTCPGCGGRLRIVEVFRRGCTPRTTVTGQLWMDSS